MQARGLAHGRLGLDRDRVLRHQVARLGGEGLAQAVLEALERLEEDRAAEELDVVRQVEVRALLGEHEVGLVMIPMQRPPSLTTGSPGSSCSRSGA
jgi:hypothetical protein